jgi:signal transduction histidine kinase
MVVHIRRLFAPPVFDGDEDKTRTARMLNTILVAGILLAIFVLGIAVPFLFHEKLYNTAFALGFLLAFAAVRRLMRRGHLRFASALFLSTSWAALTAFVCLAGGMTSLAATYYVVGTVAAGLLLGTRAALAHAGASSLAGLAMVGLEAEGYPWPRLFPMPAIAGWLDLTLSLLVTTAVLDLALRGLHDALALARQRLAEREKAEESLQASEERAELEKGHLQERLNQAQKMEAVGRLAGGIAHDFNNILTAIQGYGQLLRDDLTGDDPHEWPAAQAVRADLDEILGAAERAASLTQQLLAFSRKQVLQPRVLNLNDLLHGMEDMLRRLIGEDIDLVLAAAPDLGYVRADAGQIEQVIMNLAVNARDAMPEGGSLIFETANVELVSGAK